MGADEQQELALSRQPQSMLVPMEMIRAKKNAGAAFTLACDASGLDDKEIYLNSLLGIDPGTFSRIKKGSNSLDPDKLADFCRVVGNTIYAEWLAYQVGCTLVLIKTEAEKRAEEAEARARKAEEQVKLLKELLGGKA